MSRTCDECAAPGGCWEDARSCPHSCHDIPAREFHLGPAPSLSKFRLTIRWVGTALGQPISIAGYSGDTHYREGQRVSIDGGPFILPLSYRSLGGDGYELTFRHRDVGDYQSVGKGSVVVGE